MIEALVERIRGGARPSPEEAREIAARVDLPTLGMLADERRRRVGDRVTYVRIAAVELPAAGVEEISGGAGEVRIVGRLEGLAPALDAVRRIRSVARVPLTGFGLDDLEQVAQQEEIALADLLGRLRDAGLDLIGEAPIDGLRDPDAALHAANVAGLRVARFTSSASAPWLELFWRADELQRTHGAVRAIAPLPGLVDVLHPSTGYDDVRRVAMARLVAAALPIVQVDWGLYGPKLAQVALTFGANDLDAVAADTARDLGTRRTPVAEVRRNIEDVHLVPVERNGRFEVLET